MTRIYRILSRFGRFLAWQAPALLWLAAPAQGRELQAPCNRIAKVIATGTVAERNELARRVTGPAEDVATACPVELMRAFRDPLRAQLPRPGAAAWRAENAWLAALMKAVVPAASAQWSPLLDVTVVSQAQLTDLVVYWTAVTGTAPQVFTTLGKVQGHEVRNLVLHRAAGWLMALEAADVTSATRTAAALKELGFGFLNADAEIASLWLLRGENAPAAVSTAELRLAKDDLKGAFAAYAEAAARDKRYRLHVGILADRLFHAAKPDAARLMALGIAFSRCEDGYRVQWEYGGLSPLLTDADPEVRAEARLRARDKCREVPELPDDVDEIEQQYTELLKGFEGTRAAWQRKLAYLDRVRLQADEIGTHGRLILANELRMWIWQKASPPRAFKVLGGPTHARRLRGQVKGYLAFPPEPEIHVNERD